VSRKLPCPPIILRYKTFQKIFKTIFSAKAISFFNWGEPFLNHEIFDIIRLVSQSGKSRSLTAIFPSPAMITFFTILFNQD